MNRVTLDASIAIAWHFEEKRPEWVDVLVNQARVGAIGLVVPSLFWMEFGNRLSRDRALTDDQAVDGLLRFDSLAPETVELERPLRVRALQLAREQRLAMYEGAYLAVAHVVGAPLATLDRRLGAAAASLGISHHSETLGIKEKPATYHRNADQSPWPRSARPSPGSDRTTRRATRTPREGNMIRQSAVATVVRGPAPSWPGP